MEEHYTTYKAVSGVAASTRSEFVGTIEEYGAKGDGLNVDFIKGLMEPYCDRYDVPDKLGYDGKSVAAICAYADKGGNLDEAASDGYTLLCYAVLTDNMPLAVLLVKLGADVNKPMPSGETPLGMCADPSMRKFLVKSGAVVCKCEPMFLDPAALVGRCKDRTLTLQDAVLLASVAARYDYDGCLRMDMHDACFARGWSERCACSWLALEWMIGHGLDITPSALAKKASHTLILPVEEDYGEGMRQVRPVLDKLLEEHPSYRYDIVELDPKWWTQFRTLSFTDFHVGPDYAFMHASRDGKRLLHLVPSSRYLGVVDTTPESSRPCPDDLLIPTAWRDNTFARI